MTGHTASIRCLQCDPNGRHRLLDAGTPLLSLHPPLVADLARAHDEAEHGDAREQKIYDAIAASVAMLQAQHS